MHQECTASVLADRLFIFIHAIEGHHRFFKIEADKVDLEQIDFELRVTIEDVLELLAEHTHGKGLELAYLMHAGLPTWGWLAIQAGCGTNGQ